MTADGALRGRRCHRREPVVEVAQAGPLEVWRSRWRFDSARGLEPWVPAITRNRAIDQLRAEARHYRGAVPLDVAARVPTPLPPWTRFSTSAGRWPTCRPRSGRPSCWPTTLS
ncbi:sigma-70 family RNA polymerase sigma factor [Actinomadura sp. KC216]|nr:sigma-70 family RNA polymerase sigma factor [Actinomadura sp. KC216]